MLNREMQAYCRQPLPGPFDLCHLSYYYQRIVLSTVDEFLTYLFNSPIRLLCCCLASPRRGWEVTRRDQRVHLRRALSHYRQRVSVHVL